MSGLDELMQSQGQSTFKEQMVSTRERGAESWKMMGPILCYAFYTLFGYMIILSSAMAVPRVLTYIGIAIPGLIIYVGNKLLVHKTGKHYLKGWKKRSIYGLSAAISVFVAIPYYVAVQNAPDSKLTHTSSSTATQAPTTELTEVSSSVSTDSQKPEVQTPLHDGTLGIEWTTFCTRFNQYLAKSGTGFQMGNVTIQEDMFKHSFSDRISIGGTFTKQKLDSLLLVGQGDGSMDSAADILLVMASLVRAATPDLPDEQVKALLHNIIEVKPQSDRPDVKSSENILDGKVYHLSLEPRLGVIFSIDPIR